MPGRTHLFRYLPDIIVIRGWRITLQNCQTEVPHLQWTIMGRFPDCCCCLCTAAMMSIIPLPSAGIPISGHPWKWKCRTCCDCFSWWDGERTPLFLKRLQNAPFKDISWTFKPAAQTQTRREMCQLKMYILPLLNGIIKHYALVCRWAPCLWEWRFHTAYLQSAPQYNLQMLHCPLMANTGNTFPGWIGQMEIQLDFNLTDLCVILIFIFSKCTTKTI